MKKWSIIMGTGIIFILSIILGIYFYQINQKSDFTQQVEQLSKENNQVSEQNNQILTTTSDEEKTTPNTTFIIKKYYEQCGHTTTDYVEIPADFVNMTQKELEESYQDWQIKSFSSKEVILFKYENGFCNEHYVLREEDGVIVVYIIDENGNETLKEKTGIDTRYLPQTDLIAIKNGIYIYGNEELYTALEDYE